MSGVHDEDFSRRIAERRRLLPDMESDPIEPDAALDRRVLADAQRAISPALLPVRETRIHRPLQWAWPVGLAATLVLSFILVFLLRDRDGAPLDETATVLAASEATPDATTPMVVATAPAPGEVAVKVPTEASERAAGAADAASPAPAESMTPEAIQADPDAWFAEIERLRRAGDAAAAEREWAAFRERWPDDPRSR